MEWARPAKPLYRPKPTNTVSSSSRNKSKKAESDHEIADKYSTPADEKRKRCMRYISRESELEPMKPLPAHLAELNNSLALLCEMFPDVQVEVFREMISEFSDESRLALCADLLLNQSSTSHEHDSPTHHFGVEDGRLVLHDHSALTEGK